MDTRVYKAIIANLMDDLENEDIEPSLTPPQLEVANEARNEIMANHDWQFDDTSDKYNMHVVRQFVMRQCDTLGGHPEGKAVLREMSGKELEDFIVKLQELVK